MKKIGILNIHKIGILSEASHSSQLLMSTNTSARSLNSNYSLYNNEYCSIEKFKNDKEAEL